MMLLSTIKVIIKPKILIRINIKIKKTNKKNKHKIKLIKTITNNKISKFNKNKYKK